MVKVKGEIFEFLSKAGQKGGSVKSPAKLASGRINAAKATAARIAKHKAEKEK